MHWTWTRTTAAAPLCDNLPFITKCLFMLQGHNYSSSSQSMTTSPIPPRTPFSAQAHHPFPSPAANNIQAIQQTTAYPAHPGHHYPHSAHTTSPNMVVQHPQSYFPPHYTPPGQPRIRKSSSVGNLEGLYSPPAAENDDSSMRPRTSSFGPRTAPQFSPGRRRLPPQRPPKTFGYGSLPRTKGNGIRAASSFHSIPQPASTCLSPNVPATQDGNYANLDREPVDPSEEYLVLDDPTTNENDVFVPSVPEVSLKIKYIPCFSCTPGQFYIPLLRQSSLFFCGHCN